MCLIKTFHRHGHSEPTETFIPCSNSDRIRPCDNIRLEEAERGSGRSSQMARGTSSSMNNQVVLHQDRSPRRNEPRQERRYSSKIDVRFRGLFKSPEFSIRRLDDGGSGSGSRRGRGDGERWSSVEVMPEAPMPPLAPVHQSRRRPPPPPPSMPPTIVSPPNRPTPPQGPGAAAVITTRNTAPPSGGTPSRTSSIRSGDMITAVQNIPHSAIAAPVPSVTTHRTHHSTRGLSRLRFDSNTRFRDSAYGSSNISPVDVPKTETLSETRSNATSERSASQRFNYGNDRAVARREDYDNDEEEEEEIRSYSSGSRKSYRIVRRVRGPDNPEEAQRRMQEDLRAAEDHQSRTSEQGEGSVRFGSGSGRRRHRRRRTSDE
jgi:hypothetical protein